MTEPVKPPSNPELNEAIQFLNYWQNSGRPEQLQAAQAYATIALAKEVQNIVRKLGGIDIEIQNLRGRMP